MANKDISRHFNNADSFASAFDDAWKTYSLSKDSYKKTIDQKLDEVFKLIKEHPLFKESPSQAREIANFRIRLLKLD
ncbi:hypothetical protein [Prochlorococcus sp. MIT 1341]|uniref:hypothetical protein n=1 Tax=Prochlorococcus sp. MIT 1341 TaxID=3096221 RepID=UPI002A763067|nr:hypothetical protein [Prochlorococcus sp. MIT 1341]